MLIDIVKKDEFSSSKHKNTKKNRNKIVKSLAKSKIPNLPKFKSKNLFKPKKIQYTRNTRESNFLILSTKIVFTKLRQIFI